MAELAVVARRYARLRWVGIGLFWFSLALLFELLVAVLAGWLPASRLLVGVLGLGLSLGSFGTASDTALWAMRELRAQNQLPPAFHAEWKQELQHRPERIRTLHGAPRMALLMPLLAMAAQGAAIVRLLAAWSEG